MNVLIQNISKYHNLNVLNMVINMMKYYMDQNDDDMGIMMMNDIDDEMSMGMNIVWIVRIVRCIDGIVDGVMSGVGWGWGCC